MTGRVDQGLRDEIAGSARRLASVAIDRLRGWDRRILRSGDTLKVRGVDIHLRKRIREERLSRSEWPCSVVSAYHRRRGNQSCERGTAPLTLGLVVEEEERLILLDRATQ